MAGVQGMSQLVGPDQMKQLKEFLNTYNKITEQCFADCVNDFGSRTVLSKESTCISNCLQKYLKTTSRIGQRFEEHFIEQNEALAAQAGFLKKPSNIYCDMLSGGQLPKIYSHCVVRKVCPLCRRCISVSSRNKNVRVRFAPSPTGFLHIGGLRTALLNYLFAKSNKGSGQFVIRIEDTDQSRIVPGSVENLLKQLEWVGIKPDEGPIVGGDYGPYIQSERLPIYEKYAKQLLNNGTAYRCFCSERRLDILRRDQMQRKEQSRYDNRCRNLLQSEIEEKLTAGIPYVLRLRLHDDVKSFHDLLNGELQHDVARIEGDPVIYKTDGYPTYHLANVVDDHLMNITHVLRGKEWMISTVKHIMLYDAFGWKHPKYAHLPLLMGKDGKKLSKRQSDIFVEQYQENGYHPGSMLNFLAYYGAGFAENSLILGDEMASPTEILDKMAREFSLEKVGMNNTIVSFHKLNEYNSHILKHLLSNERGKKTLIREIREHVAEKYTENSILQELPDASDRNKYVEQLLLMRKTHITVTKDLVNDEYSYIWTRPQIKSLQISEASTKFVQNVCSFINGITVQESSKSELTSSIRSLQAEAKLKIAPAMTLLRYLLIGKKQGPSVAEVIIILGKTETLWRLKRINQFHSNTEAQSFQF